MSAKLLKNLCVIVGFTTLLCILDLLSVAWIVTQTTDAMLADGSIRWYSFFSIVLLGILNMAIRKSEVEDERSGRVCGYSKWSKVVFMLVYVIFILSGIVIALISASHSFFYPWAVTIIKILFAAWSFSKCFPLAQKKS